MRKQQPTEYEEQKALIQWLRAKNIFHFANTSENNTYLQDKKYAIIAESKAKAAGKIKGIPDLTIFLPSQILFLELKRGLKQLKSGKMSNSSSKPSKEQEAVIREINRYPYAVSVVAYGSHDAIQTIEKYLKGQNDVTTR